MYFKELKSSYNGLLLEKILLTIVALEWLDHFEVIYGFDLSKELLKRWRLTKQSLTHFNELCCLGVSLLDL